MKLSDIAKVTLLTESEEQYPPGFASTAVIWEAGLTPIKYDEAKYLRVTTPEQYAKTFNFKFVDESGQLITTTGDAFVELLTTLNDPVEQVYKLVKNYIVHEKYIAELQRQDKLRGTSGTIEQVKQYIVKWSRYVHAISQLKDSEVDSRAIDRATGKIESVNPIQEYGRDNTPDGYSSTDHIWDSGLFPYVLDSFMDESNVTVEDFREEMGYQILNVDNSPANPNTNIGPILQKQWNPMLEQAIDHTNEKFIWDDDFSELQKKDKLAPKQGTVAQFTRMLQDFCEFVIDRSVTFQEAEEANAEADYERKQYDDAVPTAAERNRRF